MNIAHVLLADLEAAGTGLVLVGELHRDTAPCWARLVGDVSPTGRGDIEIDVGARTFCDVSALNTLPAARTPGPYQGGSLRLHGALPAVVRFLAVTRTRFLMMARHRSGTAPRPGKCLVIAGPTPGIGPLTRTTNLADDPNARCMHRASLQTHTHGLTTMSEQQLIHVTAPQGHPHQLRYETVRTDRGSGERSGVAGSLSGMSPASGTGERS
ncbi:STAS domain-containing protein [Streptomyces sp. NPDC058217]|uniref:STAS domain-containing protein n=1 Tax=Streptomyces sp. NPDC058217 TaxID=3346384 RepID=UPI0036EC431C